MDVKEDDLLMFTNLTELDISDNNIQLLQLVNLQNLTVLDIQYNNMTYLTLQPHNFPKLETLRLSYNKIPPSHLVELGKLRSLQVLEIASNNLCTLPSSLSFFRHLTELNLSSNNFSSESVLVSPDQLFLSLSSIP